MKSPSKKDLEVINKIARILQGLGAPMDVVAAVDSWGDTLDSDDVMNFLGRYIPTPPKAKPQRLRFGIN